MVAKDIKKEIRKLKKLKRQLRGGTKERLDLGHRIKDLKRQLDNLTTIDAGKEKIIEEIIKLDNNFRDLFDKVYYNKFTMEELNYHLSRLKEKGGKNGNL